MSTFHQPDDKMIETKGLWLIFGTDRREHVWKVGRRLPTPAVDVVVVIDTSVSMRTEAHALSHDSDAAIDSAQARWPAGLRIVWLGLEGTWPDTPFQQTLRQYLTQTCQVPETTGSMPRLSSPPG
jgi:hypothetical protein